MRSPIAIHHRTINKSARLSENYRLAQAHTNTQKAHNQPGYPPVGQCVWRPNYSIKIIENTHTIMRESRRDVQDRSLISSRLVFFDSFLYGRALLLQVFRRRGSRPTNERITCFRACVGFRLYAPNRCSVLMPLFGCFRSSSRSRHQQHLNIDHSIYIRILIAYTHMGE